MTSLFPVLFRLDSSAARFSWAFTRIRRTVGRSKWHSRARIVSRFPRTRRRASPRSRCTSFSASDRFSLFFLFFSLSLSLSLSLFLRWQGCTDSPSPRQKSRWRLVDWRQRRVSLEWLVQSILESIGFDWDCELYSTPLALWNTIRSIRWLAIVFEFIRDFMNWMSTECIYVESKLLCNYWAIVSRLLIISFLSVTAIKGSRSLKEVILSPELSKIIFNHLNISSFDSTTSFSSTVPVASIHEVAVCDHASGKDISRQRDYYYYYYKFINNHQLAKQLHDWKIIQNVASFAHLIVLFWVYNVPSCLRITN